ncbi:MAG TPA: hypothetical protein PK573_09400 [Spirochaetota bacterium]|nr:hypothetical protein [Spirochaetota bacterium]
MTALMVLALASWMNISPYTYNDALCDIVPGGRGKDAVIEIAKVLDRTDVHYRTDPETEGFRKFMRSTTNDFNFMKLYDSPYFTDAGNGFRALRTQGCGMGEEYLISLVTGDGDRCSMSRIWDYTTSYALKKNDRSVAGGRSFIVSVNSTTATGRYSHVNALLFAEGMLKIIDPANIRALASSRCALFDNIQGESRAVIDAFCRQFPLISALFNRYTAMRSFLEIREYKGIPYASLKFRYGYRFDNLKKDYPELARSFEKVRGLYKINMKVKSQKGRTLMLIVFDSRDDALGLSLYTRGGRLVPSDDNGKPVFAEEIELSTVRDLEYYAVIDMVHDVHGLKFITDNMVVSFRLASARGRGLWTMKLVDVSKTRITGSYYNIIPAWLIDAFIPSNMEQLVYDVTRVMLGANGGEGSSVSFEWDTRDPARVMLKFSALSEFMDNYFMKYGLGVWTRGSESNKKIFDEGRELTSRFLEAFRKDYGI